MQLQENSMKFFPLTVTLPKPPMDIIVVPTGWHGYKRKAEIKIRTDDNGYKWFPIVGGVYQYRQLKKGSKRFYLHGKSGYRYNNDPFSYHYQ